MNKNKSVEPENEALEPDAAGQPAAEEQQQPEQAEAPECTAQPLGEDEELPESITLSREEFLEVRQHIEKLQKERGELVSTAQRLQADFDNFRKRNASVHLDGLEEGARNLIRDMLPVLDNFERALSADATADAAWREGVALVHKQLMDTLKKAGLSEIPTDGPFDPELHQAVMQEEVEGKVSGDVAEVLQKGYMVKDRIIRHSMVKVAK